MAKNVKYKLFSLQIGSFDNEQSAKTIKKQYLLVNL